MGKVIATCGHEIPDIDEGVTMEMTPGETGFYCYKCAYIYQFGVAKRLKRELARVRKGEGRCL